VDAGGLRASTIIVVPIVDSNDAPVIETQNFVVSEDLAPGATVGAINVTDQDLLQNRAWLVNRPPQTVSTSIVASAASAQFDVQGNNLTVRTALDFEVVRAAAGCGACCGCGSC
jgi:hypothetical protein